MCDFMPLSLNVKPRPEDRANLEYRLDAVLHGEWKPKNPGVPWPGPRPPCDLSALYNGQVLAAMQGPSPLLQALAQQQGFGPAHSYLGAAGAAFPWRKM